MRKDHPYTNDHRKVFCCHRKRDMAMPSVSIPLLLCSLILVMGAVLAPVQAFLSAPPSWSRYPRNCLSQNHMQLPRRQECTDANHNHYRTNRGGVSPLHVFFKQKEENPKLDLDSNESTESNNLFFFSGTKMLEGKQPGDKDVAEFETVNSDTNGSDGGIIGGYMDDLVKFLKQDGDDDEDSQPSTYSASDEIVQSDTNDNVQLGQIVGTGVLATILAVALASSAGLFETSIAIPNPSDISQGIQTFLANPSQTMEEVVNKVGSMGSLGFVYFGAVYTVAEILAIPAIPLTASAGYLFGVKEGTAVVLVSASIAAAVSFIIGRTFLRTYVESALDNYPEFKRIDKAIGQEGFKLMLLLRLSPIFPFALSNYLYGVTSVRFWPYFWGTMLGFAPGTVAYVYTGEIGKALTLDSVAAEPWYVYAGGLALLTGFLKVVADVATGIIENLDQYD